MTLLGEDVFAKIHNLHNWVRVYPSDTNFGYNESLWSVRILRHLKVSNLFVFFCKKCVWALEPPVAKTIFLKKKHSWRGNFPDFLYSFKDIQRSSIVRGSKTLVKHFKNFVRLDRFAPKKSSF